MDMNTINALNAYQMQSGKTHAHKTEHANQKDYNNQKIVIDYVESTTSFPSDEESVVLEKSDLIKALQNDAAARTQQLKDLVTNTLRTQAGLSVGGDDVWKFLASGNYTVTEAAKVAAQEAISENGYYGVEQTSTRIVEFAKALSGGDASKADELLEAFKKGFEEATGAWGKELPEICQQTYKAVEEKFEAWKNPTEDVASAE